MTSLQKTFALFLTALLIQGCIGTSPTPSNVQTGDLMQFTLGGIKRNANNQFISASDITASITDSSGTTYPVYVGSVYRAYPDTMSEYMISKSVNDAFYNDLEPNDGAYFVTLWLVEEIVPGSDYQMLPLQPGPATMSVTSPKLTQTNDFDFEGDYTSMNVNIIAGNSFVLADKQQELAQYTQYGVDEEGYIEIKPDVATDLTGCHGGQVKVTYNTADAFSEYVQIAAISHDKNINVIQKIEDNGDGTTSITAYFTNPNGFVDSASWTPGQSTYNDLVFGVVGRGLHTGTWNSKIWIETAESFFIDGNGDTIAGSAFTIDNPLAP